MLLLDLKCTPFSLDCTLGCGQVFRWHKDNDTWIGVVEGHVLRIRHIENRLEVVATPDDVDDVFVQRYLRLDDDLPRILGDIGRDEVIREAIQTLIGLRLVRQEAWECLASYICASFNNISRIRGIVNRLGQRFGHDIRGDPMLQSFPSASVLSKSTCQELEACGLGYRAPYLLDSAIAIAEGLIDLESLKRAPYEDAKAELMKLPGVGNKVADCVCLFALDKLDAFPVDVWIRRIIVANYSAHLSTMEGFLSLKPWHYRQINAFGRSYFGRYCGYAQQYLYARYSKVLATKRT